MDAFAFLASVLLIMFSPALCAQEQPEAELQRFDFSPFIGYRTSLSFSTSPYAGGTSPNAVIDTSPSYGFSFGVRSREEDLVEVRWIRQDSYVQLEDIVNPPPRQRIILDQFHLDCSHEPFVEDWPTWARPFVLASVGGTHVSNAASTSFTRFSFGIGAGMRFYPSRHLGFKIQAEWVPVLADPQIALACGKGCMLHVGGTASSQGEVVAGPILRF
jgi:hypothetical protein